MFIVTVKPDVFRQKEALDQKINERLARELEIRVKSRLDPGMIAPGVENASITRVAAEGNRLVIKQEKPSVSPASVGLREPATRSAEDVLFRTVTLDAALSMRAMENESFVDNSMQQLLSLEFPQHLEEAVKEVLSEKPPLFYDEERL